MNQNVELLIDDEDHVILKEQGYFLSKDYLGNFRAYIYLKTSHGWNCGIIPLSVYLLMPPKGLVVDHINGNTMDNRKANLRICTHSQNSMNSRLPSNSTTGLKGVSFKKSTKTYQATITTRGKQTYLGTFKCPLMAKLAYNKAAIKYHGEYARF